MSRYIRFSAVLLAFAFVLTLAGFKSDWFGLSLINSVKAADEKAGDAADKDKEKDKEKSKKKKKKDEEKKEEKKDDKKKKLKTDATEQQSGDKTRKKRNKERQFQTLTPEQQAEADAKKKQQIKDFVDELKRKDDVKGNTEVSKKYDESIQKLLDIIVNSPSQITLRRLAELYWKKGRRLAAEENERYQSAMEEYMKNADKEKKGTQPKFNDKAGHKYYELAISVSFKIIELFPDWDSIDEVYLFIGQNYNEMEMKDEGVNYIRKLVQDFPESKYAQDAWFLVGEYYFDKGNAMDALAAYQNAIKDKNRAIYGVARRKIGWCHYNLAQFKEAIDALQDVVSWSESQTGKGFALKDESLGDLVKFYAEAAVEPNSGVTEEDGRNFFKSKDKQKYFIAFLTGLAMGYENVGESQNTIRIYKEIIAIQPLDKKNPNYQQKIVDEWGKIGNKNEHVNAILDMVEYAKPPKESKWVEANLKNFKELVDEAWQTAEIMLVKVVTDYHTEAMKTRLDSTWEAAQKIYEIYLRYFMKDQDGTVNKNYYPSMYNYAELLYSRAEDSYKLWQKMRDAAKKQGKNPDADENVVAQENLIKSFYEKAGDQYQKVAAYDPKGKYFEDSAYNSIVAFEQIVRTEIQKAFDDSKTRQKKNVANIKINKDTIDKDENLKEQYPRKDMPSIVQKFVDSCEIYIKSSTNEKYMVDVMYKAAIMYYVHNQFPEAATKFRVIIDKYPNNKLAVFSANLVLDSLNIEGDYAQLNEVARDFFSRPSLIDKQGSLRKQFKDDLESLIEKSQSKLCFIEAAKAKNAKTKAEKDQNNMIAGNCFVAYLREFYPYDGKKNVVKYEVPKDMKGKYWSGTEWKPIKGAIKGKGDIYDRALYNSIFFFVEAGYIKNAVKMQHEFIENPMFEKSKYLEEVFFNLGTNYRAMAEYEKASEYYKKYAEKYKNGVYLKNALEFAMGYYINVGNLNLGFKLREDYLKIKDISAEERDKLDFLVGYIYLDNGDEKKAEKAFQDYLKNRAKDYKIPVLKKGKGKDKKETALGIDNENTFCKGNADNIVMAYGELVALYKKQKREKEVKEIQEKLVLFRKIEKFEKPISQKESMGVLSEAVFAGTEEKFAEFRAKNLKCNAGLSQKNFDKCIKDKLNEKLEGLKELESTYKGIIAELHDPFWSVASLTRIGLAYENMAKAFFQSTVPNYLMQVGIEVYEMYVEGLQQRSAQIEEKAIGFFVEAMNTARNYGVYNDYSKKAIEMLQQYRPTEYPQSMELFTTKHGFVDAFYTGGFAIAEPADEKKEEKEEAKEEAKDAKVEDNALDEAKDKKEKKDGAKDKAEEKKSDKDKKEDKKEEKKDDKKGKKPKKAKKEKE